MLAWHVGRVRCENCVQKSTKGASTYLSGYMKQCLDDLRQRMRLHPEMNAASPRNIAEHPFGTIKHWMGQGFFLMRGMNKVSAEISLSVFGIQP